MKSKWLVVLALICSMVVGLGGVTSREHARAAKPQQTLRTFPRALRGTWYRYEYHRYRRIQISAHSLNDDGFKAGIHAKKLPLKMSAAQRRAHPTWLIAYPVRYQHGRWTRVTGWNTWDGHGGYFRQIQQRVGGKWLPLLEIQSGAQLKTDGVAFQSKRLAKRYANLKINN